MYYIFRSQSKRRQDRLKRVFIISFCLRFVTINILHRDLYTRFCWRLRHICKLIIKHTIISLIYLIFFSGGTTRKIHCQNAQHQLLSDTIIESKYQWLRLHMSSGGSISLDLRADAIFSIRRAGHRANENCQNIENCFTSNKFKS